MARSGPAERSRPQGDAGPESVWAGLRRLATLPDWLVAAADPERVGAALMEALREAADGDQVLHSVEAKHFRLKDRRWTVTYRLTVGGAGDGRREAELDGVLDPAAISEISTNEVAGGLGSEGWRCSLPALGLKLRTPGPDTSLAALSDLTDAARACALIEEAVRANAPGYAELRLAACRPRVMRYNAGSRCTILYELEHPPGSRHRAWPQAVVAKAYRGDKGQRAYDG